MNTEIKELNNIAAIKKFFDEMSINELKKLNAEDRQELGDLCRKELSNG